MLRFYAAHFLAAFNNVLMQEGNVAICGVGGPYGSDWKQIERELKEGLHMLSEQCGPLPDSKNIQWQVKMATDSISLSPSHALNGASIARIQQFRKALIGELSGHLFYVVPEHSAHLMDAETPPFGERVATRFPDAAQDIAAGGRCLALDEWTACVFHSMRALEHGLRALAVAVGLTMSPELELENWHNIIEQIESKVRELQAVKKSVEKFEKLRHYSAAASQFRYFKDAWRNHVSHSRVSYDSREAESVWNHTRDFMQEMVEIV